jgi:hypothetical protein
MKKTPQAYIEQAKELLKEKSIKAVLLQFMLEKKKISINTLYKIKRGI